MGLQGSGLLSSFGRKGKVAAGALGATSRHSRLSCSGRCGDGPNLRHHSSPQAAGDRDVRVDSGAGVASLTCTSVHGPQHQGSKPAFISAASRLTSVSTATLYPTVPCLHCCRASNGTPPSPLQGGPHDFLDLNGNVHVPVAPSNKGPELQSCKGDAEGDTEGDAEGDAEEPGLSLQGGQGCVAPSR